MTKEEKFELANIIASAVVQTLKENGSDIDKDALVKKCVATVTSNLKSKEFGTDSDSCLSKESTLNFTKKYDFLPLYGRKSKILSEDLIRNFSSGELVDYVACKTFLERKLIKDFADIGLSNRMSMCPAYFTYIRFVQPIVNPLFIIGKDNILSLLLDVSSNDIKDIINYQKYVVTNSQEIYYKKNMIISAKENYDVEEFSRKVDVATGGEAIEYLLKNIDLQSTLKELKEKCYKSQKIPSQKAQKRINLIEYIIENDVDINKIMLSVLPVPQVDMLLTKLSEDTRKNIKKLYLSIALINDDIKYLSSFGTSEIIMNNMKRMLQESTEKLFKKSLKVYLCNDYTSNNEYKEAFDILLGNIKKYDDFALKNFFALLFCLDISKDSSEQHLFSSFLLENNAFEDQLIWKNFKN